MRQQGACQSTQQLLKPKAGLLHEQMSKTSPEQTHAELRLPACGPGAAGADPPQGGGAQPCHTQPRASPGAELPVQSAVLLPGSGGG